ncbi:MAG: glycosyltransferase family 1 protein, partial [Bacteroidales bacterium]|nr:glycosyltransferase family 1 protein [Bacteroidales bacterium]
MKIALTTIGSRGDIQPYIALGIALKSNDHSVTILTHPWAEKIINSYELSFLSVGENIDINFIAKQFVENSATNLKGLKFALNFIFDNLRKCHFDLLSKLKDFDLIIGHGIVGNAEADMLNKPFITVSIETMGLQKEYWKSINIFKELCIFLSDKLTGAIFGKPYRKFREEIGASPIGNNKKHRYLALVPISNIIQKSNPNWKKLTEITGFFFADTPNDFKPDKSLQNFINKGEKPILITFGSMHHKQTQSVNLYNIICESLTKSQSRALLIMPDLDIKKITIPENVFIINQIPYSWLLNQVSMVIHHFGFGTTAEVLKAGLPSIPIPHIFDQKIRSNQIYTLGYATKPLNLKNFNSKILSNAILKVKSDKNLQVRCKELGIKISNEKGTDKAVELINKHFNY